MKSLTELTSRWAMQCLANPSFIITTSGDHFVLYDLNKHKVVEHEQFGNLNLKSERRNEN